MPTPPESPTQPPNGGSRPVPDPTVLTTQLVDRGNQAVLNIIEGKLEVLRERLTGIDRATELRLTGIVDIPVQIDEKVNHLKGLVDERFSSVQTQFKERDTRSERESRDNKVAVDAAFAAQKEAAAKQEETFSKGIDKSENATQETITKLTELFQTTMKGLADKLEDMKDRVGRLETNLGRVEQAKATVAETRTGFNANIALIVTVILAVLAIIAFFIGQKSGPSTGALSSMILFALAPRVRRRNLEHTIVALRGGGEIE